MPSRALVTVRGAGALRPTTPLMAARNRAMGADPGMERQEHLGA